jgi:hypothetical protein
MTVAVVAAVEVEIVGRRRTEVAVTDRPRMRIERRGYWDRAIKVNNLCNVRTF